MMNLYGSHPFYMEMRQKSKLVRFALVFFARAMLRVRIAARRADDPS
jgi:hypothetical protein